MMGSRLLWPPAMSMDWPRGSLSARFLLFLCVCCCFFRGLTAKRLHPDEVGVLKQIDAKLKVGWDFSVDPCSGKNGWLQDNTTGINHVVRNVTCGNCDANICRIVNLSLKTQNLTGVLPPEVANLTSLAQLDLTRNYINGTIPYEWATLSVLNISLGGNRISGRIPNEIGDIASLESLVLENNLLEGPIPSSLGRLQNLSRLILSGNYLTGELPESLGNLKSLIDFRIDGNDIHGKVPRFIGNLTNLLMLHIQGTSLEGPFHSEISTLQNIFELLVSDFKGDGNFPPLQNMKLKKLILRNCSISGKLPAYIGKMKTLKVLDLSFNNFTGEIPHSYRGLALSIDNLYVTNNMLTGRIPDWIRNSRKVIDVSYNNFEASSAPTYCEQQGTLVNVLASSSLSKSKVINHCLRKDFPCSKSPKNYNLFINCGGEAVKIGDDQYDQDIALMGASTFFLSSNKKWAFSSTGDFFGNPLANYVAKNNTVINTDNPELYMRARLSPSSLKYYGLCLHKGNYTVNLHFSEITFVDGNTFFSVGRRYFDVYIQVFSTSVVQMPQDRIVLKDFNIVAEANGTGREVIKSFNATVDGTTLEIDFRWSGKGTNSVPEKGVYGPLISAISVTPKFTPFMESSNGLTLRSVIGIVIGLLVVFLILIIFLFSLRRKYYDNDGLRDINLQISQFSLRLIRAATGNFDHANKIGEGGFGPVFKGVLPNGTPVAVKQLSSWSRQGNREFITEIGMISALQHPNLVKLLGCCIEGNQLLLVYEYMENNSLSHILFGPGVERVKLDWKTRCDICLGIARGLKYLHEESTIKIVHRDIKATNILLDKDLNVKISDFGLAKLDDAKNTHISTRIVGTRGYMAPEYAMRGHLTDKADVYGFGIILLEIVSGKNNVIFMPDMEDVHLIDWAYNLEENGKPLQLVDERLGSDYPEEEALQMIKLALLCANASPSVRPTMSKVVSILESKEPVPIPSVTQGISKSEELKLRTFQGVHPHANLFDGGWNGSGQNPVFSSDESLLS